MNQKINFLLNSSSELKLTILAKSKLEIRNFDSNKLTASSQVLNLKNIKLSWKIFEFKSRQVEKLNLRTQIELKSWIQQLDSTT